MLPCRVALEVAARSRLASLIARLSCFISLASFPSLPSPFYTTPLLAPPQEKQVSELKSRLETYDTENVHLKKKLQEFYTDNAAAAAAAAGKGKKSTIKQAPSSPDAPTQKQESKADVAGEKAAVKALGSRGPYAQNAAAVGGRVAGEGAAHDDDEQGAAVLTHEVCMPETKLRCPKLNLDALN